jgi:hypothetical protein
MRSKNVRICVGFDVLIVLCVQKVFKKNAVPIFIRAKRNFPKNEISSHSHGMFWEK